MFVVAVQHLGQRKPAVEASFEQAQHFVEHIVVSAVMAAEHIVLAERELVLAGVAQLHIVFEQVEVQELVLVLVLVLVLERQQEEQTDILPVGGAEQARQEQAESAEWVVPEQ